MTLGEQLKLDGLNRVAGHNKDFLDRMRMEAFRLSNNHGRVTIDDMRSYAEQNNIYPDHQNAWGAIFKGKCWERIGYIKSTFPSNHARMISVWVYKPSGEQSNG